MEDFSVACRGGRLFLAEGASEREVLTVAQAARRLRLSRRQVYRLLPGGRLGAPVKVLGEWLLDAAATTRAAKAPAQRQRLPASLAALLPEYSLGDLNAGRDAELVLARVLEEGGLADARWARRRYGSARLARFIEERGHVLSPRSRRLWSLVFGAEPSRAPEWRARGPWTP